MTCIQSSNEHNKVDSTSPEPGRSQEEVFLNAFVRIAKKGIKDWEKTKNLKTNDG